MTAPGSTDVFRLKFVSRAEAVGLLRLRVHTAQRKKNDVGAPWAYIAARFEMRDNQPWRTLDQRRVAALKALLRGREHPKLGDWREDLFIRVAYLFLNYWRRALDEALLTQPEGDIIAKIVAAIERLPTLDPDLAPSDATSIDAEIAAYLQREPMSLSKFVARLNEALGEEDVREYAAPADSDEVFSIGRNFVARLCGAASTGDPAIDTFGIPYLLFLRAFAKLVGGRRLAALHQLPVTRPDNAHVPHVALCAVIRLADGDQDFRLRRELENIVLATFKREFNDGASLLSPQPNPPSIRFDQRTKVARIKPVAKYPFLVY